MKKTFLLLLTLLILSACSGNTASLEGEWTLVSYGDASSPTPALPNVETSINFGADGQFGGTVGCNSFGAEYTVSGDTITIGSIVSTMMFCEDVNEQESAVLGSFSDKTLTIQSDGDTLTLSSADGTSVVALARK
ncbi:MAG: META domain-containing protein [Anaerolineales bacterium]|jgi:heat shock protein HslJ|nr:META domain-containing protein [Anaerolineales bacterium]